MEIFLIIKDIPFKRYKLLISFEGVLLKIKIFIYRGDGEKESRKGHYLEISYGSNNLRTHMVCAFHSKDALIGSQALKGTKTIGAPSVGQNYL